MKSDYTTNYNANVTSIQGVVVKPDSPTQYVLNFMTSQRLIETLEKIKKSNLLISFTKPDIEFLLVVLREETNRAFDKLNRMNEKVPNED